MTASRNVVTTRNHGGRIAPTAVGSPAQSFSHKRSGVSGKLMNDIIVCSFSSPAHAHHWISACSFSICTGGIPQATASANNAILGTSRALMKWSAS